MKRAIGTFLWQIETFWWHLCGPVRRRRLRCDHPCCRNKEHAGPDPDQTWGVCPCWDHYRSTLTMYVQCKKEQQ